VKNYRLRWSIDPEKSHLAFQADNIHMYLPRNYWTSLAEEYGSVDASGLAPILHPNAPVWFNLVIDQLQLHALRKAIAIAEVPPRARFLDVGCGTGRWVRRRRLPKLTNEQPLRAYSGTERYVNVLTGQH
jgi:hypothetical protein